MLQSLLKIGEWQGQGRTEWDRFLDYAKVEREDKYGNVIRSYTLPIVFDLDEKEVIISQEHLIEYDEEKIKSTFPLKIKGGNNKAIYTSVFAEKVNQVYKTFFGKEGVDTATGELVEAIEKTNHTLLTEDLKSLLSQIFELKNKFLQLTTSSSEGAVDIREIKKSFNLAKNENIVFVTVQIKSDRFGFKKAVPFSEIADYRAFLRYSFLGDQHIKNPTIGKYKLCYASGEMEGNVEELKLTTRYSLNKMFVTETKNYASFFNKKNFTINYQVSRENQEKLDYASDYLLNKGYKVEIANLKHVIIPQFLKRSEIDLELALTGIHRKSDLLFNFNRLDKFSRDIQDEIDEEIFWINFVAFESDGNYFKSIEVIKDISNLHLSKLLNVIDKINWELREVSFMDWDKVMTEFDYDSKSRLPSNLNFNSIFKIIPSRKDKEKKNKNKALELFKAILENRRINKSILYSYFVELVLCHYYQRYGSYTSVQEYSKDYFSVAVRDSVFKYHGLFLILKKLNLIEMEETTINLSTGNSKNKYEQAIQEFFSKMSLNQEQKAMFYLGRMLNAVEYIQKGKAKTVIQKVNFNGMDKDDIQRLRISLVEKAKQYNAISKILFIDNEFSMYFNFNAWDLSPQEAVFFLLTGYSFGVGVKDAEKLIVQEIQETI